MVSPLESETVDSMGQLAWKRYAGSAFISAEIKRLKKWNVWNASGILVFMETTSESLASMSSMPSEHLASLVQPLEPDMEPKEASDFRG